VSIDLSQVPEPLHDVVSSVLGDEFGSACERVEPGPSGASGASTFRVDASDGAWLLRVEGDRLPTRNPHQYRNLHAAADAGISPPVRVADEAAGVLVVRWIDAQPLSDHPGGPAGLARELGELVARVQQLEPFPDGMDWADGISLLLGHLVATGRYAPGTLDAHVEAWEHIRAAWRRDPRGFVPAHNDPNAANLLYDGTRVWLVDWETSSPNDPMVDLGVVANQLSPTPALAEVLLGAWHGGPPDDRLRAELALAQVSAKLWAASMLAAISAGDDVPKDLTAPTIEEFGAAVASGSLSMATPAGLATFAAIVFGQVVADSSTSEFAEALRIASDD